MSFLRLLFSFASTKAWAAGLAGPLAANSSSDIVGNLGAMLGIDNLAAMPVGDFVQFLVTLAITALATWIAPNGPESTEPAEPETSTAAIGFQPNPPDPHQPASEIMSMKRLLPVVPALLALFVTSVALTACTGSLFDQFADDVIVEDASPDERSFRAVAFLTGVSELAADRVTNREPDTAGETLIAVRQLETAIVSLSAIPSDDPFFETTLFETDTAIIQAMRNVAERRVRSIINAFAGGGVPSVDSVLQSLEAGAKAAAMRRDAIRGIEKLRSGETTLEDLLTAWRARFDANLRRIETLNDIQAQGDGGSAGIWLAFWRNRALQGSASSI